MNQTSEDRIKAHTQDAHAWPKWLLWGMISAVGIGIFARIFRLLVNLQLWGDEAYLAASLIYKDYAELWGPLANRQVAPAVYSILTKAAWELLGVMMAFKLPSFLFGGLAVGLFALVVFKFLDRKEAWWAMVLFAVSAPLLRYSVEVKQYSLDLCLSIVMLGLSWQFIEQLKLRQEDIITTDPPYTPLFKSLTFHSCLIIFPALSIWASFPMVLICGSMGLLMLVMMVKRKAGTKAWLSWAASGLLFLISMGLLYSLYLTHLQEHPTAEFMQQYWKNQGAFMPLSEPWHIPFWLLKVHTGHGFGFPAGEKNFASSFTTLLILGGLWTLYTQKRRIHLLLLVTPFLVAILFSGFAIYPYGVSSRLMLYLAPLICILVAIGINGVTDTLKGPLKTVWIIALLALMIGVPVGQMGWLVHRRVEQQKQRNYEGQLKSIQETQNITPSPIYIMNPFTPFEGNGTNIYFDMTTDYYLKDRAHWDRTSTEIIQDIQSNHIHHFIAIAQYPSDPEKVEYQDAEAWFKALDARFTMKDSKTFIYMSDTQRIKVVFYRTDQAQTEK